MSQRLHRFPFREFLDILKIITNVLMLNTKIAARNHDKNCKKWLTLAKNVKKRTLKVQDVSIQNLRSSSAMEKL